MGMSCVGMPWGCAHLWLCLGRVATVALQPGSAHPVLSRAANDDLTSGGGLMEAEGWRRRAGGRGLDAEGWRRRAGGGGLEAED